jgi:hypothetical protein
MSVSHPPDVLEGLGLAKHAISAEQAQNYTKARQIYIEAAKKLLRGAKPKRRKGKLNLIWTVRIPCHNFNNNNNNNNNSHPNPNPHPKPRLLPQVTSIALLLNCMHHPRPTTPPIHRLRQILPLTYR